MYSYSKIVPVGSGYVSHGEEVYRPTRADHAWPSGGFEPAFDYCLAIGFVGN